MKDSLYIFFPIISKYVFVDTKIFLKLSEDKKYQITISTHGPIHIDKYIVEANKRRANNEGVYKIY